MSGAINIKFWGVRGSTPCANIENMEFGGNTTCLQIEASPIDELLIIDCGTGLRNLGNHLLNHDKKLNGRIFITHPHWDHLQGFPFFKPFYKNEAWFRVYMPPQKDVSCVEILQGHMSNTFFPVTIDMLLADMNCESFSPGTLNLDGYSVEYMWARHTVPTAIYKFRIGGKVIIFGPDNELPLSTDSEEDEAFVEEFRAFVKDADVLIHDGQFNGEQHKERIGWGHSCWERVIEVTKTCGIKKLVLTHHDPDSTDDYLEGLNENLKKNFQEGFGEAFFVKEGQDISLPLS